MEMAVGVIIQSSYVTSEGGEWFEVGCSRIVFGKDGNLKFDATHAFVVLGYGGLHGRAKHFCLALSRCFAFRFYGSPGLTSFQEFA
jgi:hypothetical protein